MPTFEWQKMGLYQEIAEKLQYVSPAFYKKRYFKKIIGLNRENVFQRKVEPEILWIRSFLKKNDVFLDVGANVGQYLFALQDILKHENIYAFEPNKKLCSRLERIFEDMNIFPIALSDKNEEAEFKIPILKGKAVPSRGTLQIEIKEDGEDLHQIQKVKVMRLDRWAEIEDFKKISFIKIDVEGNEMHTLHGAESVIRKFRPTVMVEMEQRHHTEPIWTLISEIERWNYRAHFLNRETFQLEKLSQEFIEDQDAANVKNYKNYINNIIFLAK